MRDEVVTWHVDDVIQISPTHDERFGASMLVVTETRMWGVIGYVLIPGSEREGGRAFYRLPYMPTKEGCSVTGVRIGRAHWLMGDDDGEL